MIANEREYRITKAAAKDFEEALARLDVVEEHQSAEMRQIMRDGMESQLADLREQLAEYDALHQGHLAVLEFDSLDNLPTAFIQGRIAAGLTQKQLAARLGLKEQQIQRYEATRYAGASLSRIQAVANALGLKIHERVVLPNARTAS
jgi:ribosome-binding protein aMBF1 (putative translation factor)